MLHRGVHFCSSTERAALYVPIIVSDKCSLCRVHSIPDDQLTHRSNSSLKYSGRLSGGLQLVAWRTTIGSDPNFHSARNKSNGIAGTEPCFFIPLASFLASQLDLRLPVCINTYALVGMQQLLPRTLAPCRSTVTSHRLSMW